MACNYCKGKVEFPSKDEGAVTKCPHCNAVIRLKAENNPTEGEKNPTEIYITVGYWIVIAGMVAALYFSLGYPLSSQDASVISAVRLHYSLCGVIIGVGISIIGAILAGVGMLMTLITGLVVLIGEFFKQQTSNKKE